MRAGKLLCQGFWTVRRLIAGSVVARAENTRSFTGSAIRTAELGNRDERAHRRALPPIPAVFGSDSINLNCQNPAESRGFIELRLDIWEESLPRRLNGGGGRLGGTGLWGAIPV